MTSENQMIVEAKPESLNSLPVLPLKNSVLFPHLFMPLSVGRPASLAAIEASLATEEKSFLAVALKNPDADPPTADDLYTVGTRAVIKKMARTPSGDRAIGSGNGARGAGRSRSDRTVFEGRVSGRCRCRTIPGTRSRHSAGRSSS